MQCFLRSNFYKHPALDAYIYVNIKRSIDVKLVLSILLYIFVAVFFDFFMFVFVNVLN